MAETKGKNEDTRQVLKDYLDQPRWRGSFAASVSVAAVTIAGMAGTVALMLSPLAHSLFIQVVLTFLWSLWVVRSFMLLHDAGHGSFCQGFEGAVTYNKAGEHIFAVLCGTPTEWNKGHALHHQNIGNIGQDDYDWGETIFHTKSQFLAFPRWKQQVYRVVRHPVVFFLLAPIAVWWVQFRLPFELRPGRKAAKSFFTKFESTVFMGIRYYLAYERGILHMILAGDYLAMLIGLVLFHLQHAYDAGYVRDPASGWNRFDASFKGSSLLIIPKWLKFFLLGIEYHHIHHYRIRIPGYLLQQCHEEADPSWWDEVGVVTLDYPAMWKGLWNTLYDDESQQYITFDQVHTKKV